MVELYPGPDEFQPFACVCGERFRERMVALSPNPEAAVNALHQAEPPNGATFELVDHLDEDATRACREIAAALAPCSESDEHDRSRASTVLGELGRELVVWLNRRAWPDASTPRGVRGLKSPS